MSRFLLSAVAGAFVFTLSVIGFSTTMVDEANACPTYQGSPHFGTVNLTEGFLPDPWNRRVTAGGRNDLSNCGLGYWGWVARRPDYRVQYNTSGNSALTFIIQSNIDTVLLINDPFGNWHFDDDGGQDLGAALRMANAPSGQYDIWIGSYNRGSGIPATLQISERY